MTDVSNGKNVSVDEFVAQVKEDAEFAFQALREIGTRSANGTVSIVERIPGRDQFVFVSAPDPLRKQTEVVPHVGNLHEESPILAAFGGVLNAYDDVTTVIHVHSPYLGAWAQTHRPLPIRYAASQRLTLAREIPAYIDRTQTQVDFILEKLKENPHLPAILEANGGATVWGKQGLLKTVEFIVVLEEGAQFQLLAEAAGGAQEFGAGVLAQQWQMTGLTEEATREGLLPASG
jgi:ribulose-5-phosphate 4-epimerase/fuculose-1-phosphate aldolase